MSYQWEQRLYVLGTFVHAGPELLCEWSGYWSKDATGVGGGLRFGGVTHDHR